MAVYLSSPSNYLRRTSGAFLSVNSFSIGFWLRLRSAWASARTYLYMPGTTTGYLLVKGVSGGDLAIDGRPDGGALLSNTLAITLTPMTWYYLAIGYAVATTSLTATVYDRTSTSLGAASIPTLDYTGTTFTAERLGSNAGSATQSDFDVAYYRTYTGGGGGTGESVSSVAVNLSGLQSDLPLIGPTSLYDYSGNGRNWSAVGSPAASTSPPLDPWQLHQIDIKYRTEATA